MDTFPLFTVIIPQKDRAEYLVHTLRTCMIQDYPNFEIIISDDCSSDNSVEVIKKLMRIDSRIKLFTHEKHIGMRNNFEFALNQIRPGYVIALGGDDGLLPGCIWKMYEILKSTKKEVLTWPLAHFVYPNDDLHNNIFYIKRKKNRKIQIIKSKDFFSKISKNFIYQIDECPMFYMKGVVSTLLIDRVKSRTKDNCFYYCPTPDGFSGVVIAGEVEDYAYTNEPLTIGGSTIKSQGLNYKRTDSKSRNEAEQFFNDNIRRSMHSELASQPYSPLEPLMTADYIMTALDLPNWPGKEFVRSVNFENLIIETFKFIKKSNFDNLVLKRELLILREISNQHDLLPLFNKLFSQTKRKYITSNHVYGFVITNSIRFNGKDLGINNIFDASIATPFLYNFYNKFSFKLFKDLVFNTYKVFMRSKDFRVEELPKID